MEKEQITIEDFQKIDLRTATVLEAADHPNADRLLLLKVDLGAEQRQVVAGIKSRYEPETLVGKQVVILANLKPAVLRGEESHGMLLAVGEDEVLSVITTDNSCPEGSVVR